MTIHTLRTISLGRRYIKCLEDHHYVMLDIDDLTRDLPMDHIITFEAEDLSTSNKYGTKRRLRATSTPSVEPRAVWESAQREKRRSDKVLEFAESDVALGLSRTRAILEVLAWPSGHEHADRATQLRQAVEANIAKDAANAPLKTARKWLAHATSDVSNGKTMTKAIRIALATAGDFPSLQEPLSELKAGLLHLEDHPEDRRELILLPWTQPVGSHCQLPGSPGWVVITAHLGRHRITDDDPSIYGSHLLGHEDEWCTRHEYRPATEEESAPWREAQRLELEAEMDYDRARAEMRELINSIKETGDFPSDVPTVDGERFEERAPNALDSFAVGPEHIWYLRYNGADGDTWANNNVGGCMAWRIPWDQVTADRIRSIYERINGN